MAIDVGIVVSVGVIICVRRATLPLTRRDLGRFPREKAVDRGSK
jgi:hypothetical protein